jgi:hypothetical protein
LADPLSFVCPGAKSEPDAPSLAPDDPLDRSRDDPLDFNPEELEFGPEFDMPVDPRLPPVSPAPCANATGALNNSATMATEYFNIVFSYADYPLSSGYDNEREILTLVPSLVVPEQPPHPSPAYAVALAAVRIARLLACFSASAYRMTAAGLQPGCEFVFHLRLNQAPPVEVWRGAHMTRRRRCTGSFSWFPLYCLRIFYTNRSAYSLARGKLWSGSKSGAEQQ